MKVVIIGGGIAGLTLGILLRKQDIEVVINERTTGMPVRGHAFLMHTDGLAILNELNCCSTAVLKSKSVDAFSLRRPDGTELKHLKLNSWQCIKRVDLIEYLYSLFPGQVKEGREFSHFVYEDGQVVAAAFLNGAVEYGDIFVGADGGNSRVRESMFGKVHFSAVNVKEIVGVSNKRKIVKNPQSEFIKFQNRKNGLAFGLIPTTGTEFVWFMQYDPSISDLTDSTPDALKSFCHKLLRKFPPMVAALMDENDFSTSYVWNTRDFDLLPSFHRQNVVLIGDAAHLALPFTSAGTTNAIVDAKTLAQCLAETFDYKQAFKNYYEQRAADVAKHIELGRELKHLFLNPHVQNDDDLPVPLISVKDDAVRETKLIKVLYFTDPICSTCWIIQPLLRKLKLEYDSYIDIDYKMGGLLPTWNNYNKGIIQKPSDAAKHWEEVSVSHEMPLDGDVWLEDPLASSYPPSIAFKAAQIQDANKAILFLRRIKEMVFLEKKNIIKWGFLEKAALDTGLDSARLLRDIEGRAKKLFDEDLDMAKELGVTVFPTLFFSNCSDKKFVIKGYQPYENFEEIIRQLIPDAQKAKINADPRYLFNQFSTMTEKEFAFLSNISRSNAVKILTELYFKGFVSKYESKNGIIWMDNFPASNQGSANNSDRVRLGKS
jgi:2-polyprenyl-6-methoxyphenol hydroxylase-like FAD-dependent oxidoreductase/predicted DsbA family dithiol-disulfide isomerase